MTDARQRPRIPEVLDFPELRTARHRGVGAMLALAGWALWLYLLTPLLALGGWVFGFGRFEEYVLDDPLRTAFTVQIYVLVVIVAGALFLGWAIYNMVRFRGRERRRAPPPVNAEGLARSFGLDPFAVQRTQGARVGVVQFDEDGRVLDTRLLVPLSVEKAAGPPGAHSEYSSAALGLWPAAAGCPILSPLVRARAPQLSGPRPDSRGNQNQGRIRPDLGGREVANQPIKMDAGNKVLLFVSAIALAGAVIFLVAQLVNWLGQMGVAERTPISEEELTARLTPAGRVEAGTVEVDEEEAEVSAGDIYQNVCAACHDTGASDAPIIDDSEEWASRFDEKGLDTLFEHSIEGFNAMPARGGDSSLSDEEVQRAVAYMLDQADVDHGWSPDNGDEDNGNGNDEENGNDNGNGNDEDEAAEDDTAANGDTVNGIDLAAGDAARAESQLYGRCISCHGAQGQGVGIFPSIAGESAEFIAQRLVAYRAGETVGDDTHLMAPNARNLSDEDIADLAVFIAEFEG
ncbi:poly-beta-1,6-N-acetyl-D-glucosamine biosynthesis protein PgaD [Thioalkalivibrio sp. ALE21]|nr:poly-beta-1,6-N-acetyl-D-glucosamine biosynthesis protein PgaD [Thioalkalivibrio sp. ALE21]